MKIQFAALLVLFAAAEARRSPSAPTKRAFVPHNPYAFGLAMDEKPKEEPKDEKAVKEVKNGEYFSHRLLLIMFSCLDD